MRIAIVGMGGAGISVLREWTRLQKECPEIQLTVYGDEQTFGTGLPYQSEDDSVLLNQPAEWMTLHPDNPFDFVEWLQLNCDIEDPRGHYYPRALFGQYMKERMQGWLTLSQAVIIKEQVETVKRSSTETFFVSTASTTEEFDAVHMCIGHLPFKDSYHLKGHSSYIHHPYPLQEKLADIPKNANIGVLGTGLTALDILRYTHLKRPDLTVSFYSRSGEFKSIRAKELASTSLLREVQLEPPFPDEKNKFSSLQQYADWATEQGDKMGFSFEDVWKKHSHGNFQTLKKERDAGEDLKKLHLLMHKMDDYLVDMWTALPEIEKKRFLKKYGKAWDRIRSPYPFISGDLLVKLLDRGAILAYGGLKNITESEDGFELHLENERIKEETYLVNAMGPDREVSVDHRSFPLMDQMLNEGLLQSERWGGIQVMWPSVSVVTQKYGVIENLKVHGQFISGIQFGNNGIMSVSTSAIEAVKHVFAYMMNRKEKQRT